MALLSFFSEEADKIYFVNVNITTCLIRDDYGDIHNDYLKLQVFCN